MHPPSPAARTILYFSYYVWAAALALLLTPQTLLQASHTPGEAMPWVRVTGAVLLILGLYYQVCGRTEQRGFFWATVWGRWAALPLFGVLALLGWVPWVMAAGTLIDFAAAFWTAHALREPQ